MSDVLNRQTLELVRAVNTPDFSEVDWVINPVMPDNYDPKYYRLQGNVLVALKDADKAAVDAAVLMQAKIAKVITIAQQVNDFIQAKYTLEHQQTLSYLMDEAEREGLRDRFDYYNQVGIWAKHVLGYYYSLFDVVFICSSLSEVAAVAPDFGPFFKSDPGVKIRAGLAIAT